MLFTAVDSQEPLHSILSTTVAIFVAIFLEREDASILNPTYRAVIGLVLLTLWKQLSVGTAPGLFELLQNGGCGK